MNKKRPGEKITITSYADLLEMESNPTPAQEAVAEPAPPAEAPATPAQPVMTAPAAEPVMADTSSHVLATEAVVAAQPAKPAPLKNNKYMRKPPRQRPTKRPGRTGGTKTFYIRVEYAAAIDLIAEEQWISPSQVINELLDELAKHDKAFRDIVDNVKE